jgi:hypothetical protein
MPVCDALIMLAAYFCYSFLSQVEYNCSIIKVYWLDACIALRVIGAVLVVFLRRWRKIILKSSKCASEGFSDRSLAIFAECRLCEMEAGNQKAKRRRQ